MSSCWPILESFNLFSGVKLGIRSFCFISALSEQHCRLREERESNFSFKIEI